MCRARGQGYAGQGLELADVLAVLHAHHLRADDGATVDRLVLSTGHSAVGLYALLVESGLYTEEEVLSYGLDGSEIEESPLETAPGFEVTGGSLGQGPSQAVGLALGERMQGSGARVFCELSDGELQEGAVWEAFMFASHHQLSDLIFFVDANGEQADGAVADILALEPIEAKLAAFGLDVYRVDGHDHDAVDAAFTKATASAKPACVVVDTVPGKGSPTLESHTKVHYVRVDDAVWSQIAEEVARG